MNAASTVSVIIGDLDRTIMFATAGTLHAENENETLSDHRGNILKTAKALIDDTKTLIARVVSSQEQLAVAAQNAVTTIIQLAEVVKLGAASLGSNNPEAQVLLINAVKDVATALGDLVQATKAASGKTIHDPEMIHLRKSAKVMVTNVTSLLKTVTSVEDEHSRGTRALESTIEAIGQEIRQAGNAVKKATDNLVRAAQQAIEHDEERSLIINKRMVGGIAQEIINMEEIIRMERELEVAREKLTALRKAKYGNRSPDDYQGYGFPWNLFF